MTIDVVTTDDALYRLATPWQSLWRRVPEALPFQSPLWLLPWWRVFGTGHPVCACLYIDGRLSGVLPLYMLDDAEGRKLLPIGVSLSDYFDVLLQPGIGHSAVDELLRAALRMGAAQGATMCDLTDVPIGASLRNLGLEWRETTPCPVLHADATLPSGLRRKLRMNSHRAARMGGLSFEWGAEDLLPLLLHWNAQRWGTDARTLQFHEDVAPGLLGAKLMRIAVLRIGGHIAACCSVMPAGVDRLLFYMIGFDPAFAHASPGTLLVRAIIDAMVVERRSEMHFLRGGEAYKYAWGAQDQYNAACRLMLS